MASVKRFEDLYVWQQARELTNFVYHMTDKKRFPDWSLANQLQRAAVSVMSNIAEGFERGSKEEQVAFYYIAKGSAGEVRCHLYIAYDRNLITMQELNEGIALAETVSSAIFRLIESMKVSRFKGLKFKRPVDRDAEAFEKQLKEMTEAAWREQGIIT